MEKLELTTEKLKETNDEFVEIRRQAIKAKENFDRVKAQRYKLFMDCFDFVSNEIDDIYKVSIMLLYPKFLKTCTMII